MNKKESFCLLLERDVTDFVGLSQTSHHAETQKVMKNEIFISYLVNCHLSSNPLNMHSRATKHD